MKTKHEMDVRSLRLKEKRSWGSWQSRFLPSLNVFNVEALSMGAFRAGLSSLFFPISRR